MSLMDVENILLRTTPFFESGFNGLAWSLATNPEFDQYYFDILPITDSRPFHEELRCALEELEKQRSDLAVVDDGSLEAALIKAISAKMTIVNLKDLPEPERDFINLCQEKYQLDDPEMILGLYAGNQFKQSLLFPRWQCRILNVNYSRSRGESIGQPYFVFVENEKFHRLRVAQLELGIWMSWNFLLSSPTLFRSYFFHPEITKWLEMEFRNGPHNYEAERILFLAELRRLGAFSGSTHKMKWDLGAWSKSLKPRFPPQQAAFPLHLLFEKIFRCQSPHNKLERSLYGS